MFEGRFQPVHLIIILVIVLIVFGPGQLSSIGGATGKTIREFKDGVEGGEDDPANRLGSGAAVGAGAVPGERITAVPGSDPADV